MFRRSNHHQTQSHDAVPRQCLPATAAHNAAPLIVGAVPSREALLLRPKAVAPQLRCAVCHLVAARPQTSPAGHVYCAECIHDALAARQVCPVTGGPLSPGDLCDVATGRPVLWAIFQQVEVRR